MKKIIFIIALLTAVSFSLIVSGATLNYKKANTVSKQSFKLKVKGAKKIKWFSSNYNVATVKKGRVSTHKKGKATITAKVGNKKYVCKINVWSKNKMYNELIDIVEYFDYLKSDTVNLESYKSIKKGVEITKNMQTENKAFVKKLVGKKHRKFKKDYKKAVRHLKKMNKHLKQLLATIKDKDEYGYHTDEYEEAYNDYDADIWKWWTIRGNLRGDTGNIYIPYI